MEHNDFDPARAARLILNLRVENRQLRSRLRNSDQLSAQELPAKWHKKLADLRKENAKFRTQRNQLREELAAARAELEARRK
ncbi:MAG: hypothetical protein ACXVXI_05245 [Mycobacteriaceae bacterium]